MIKLKQLKPKTKNTFKFDSDIIGGFRPVANNPIFIYKDPMDVAPSNGNLVAFEEASDSIDSRADNDIRSYETVHPKVFNIPPPLYDSYETEKYDPTFEKNPFRLQEKFTKSQPVLTAYSNQWSKPPRQSLNANYPVAPFSPARHVDNIRRHSTGHHQSFMRNPTHPLHPMNLYRNANSKRYPPPPPPPMKFKSSAHQALQTTPRSYYYPQYETQVSNNFPKSKLSEQTSQMYAPRTLHQRKESSREVVKPQHIAHPVAVSSVQGPSSQFSFSSFFSNFHNFMGNAFSPRRRGVSGDTALVAKAVHGDAPLKPRVHEVRFPHSKEKFNAVGPFKTPPRGRVAIDPKTGQFATEVQSSVSRTQTESKASGTSINSQEKFQEITDCTEEPVTATTQAASTSTETLNTPTVETVTNSPSTTISTTTTPVTSPSTASTSGTTPSSASASTTTAASTAVTTTTTAPAPSTTQLAMTTKWIEDTIDKLPQKDIVISGDVATSNTSENKTSSIKNYGRDPHAIKLAIKSILSELSESHRSPGRGLRFSNTGKSVVPSRTSRFTAGQRPVHGRLRPSQRIGESGLPKPSYGGWNAINRTRPSLRRIRIESPLPEKLKSMEAVTEYASNNMRRPPTFKTARSYANEPRIITRESLRMRPHQTARPAPDIVVGRSVHVPLPPPPRGVVRYSASASLVGPDDFVGFIR